jgi:hypothetical protein
MRALALASIFVVGLACLEFTPLSAGAQGIPKKRTTAPRAATSRPKSGSAAKARPTEPAADSAPPVALVPSHPVTVADSIAITPDTVAAAPVAKKKGGLFGAIKGVAKNKVVQQVAKTAACTMVPGGQYVVGALDAASSKSAGQAAAGAAGAATGSNCMPGGAMGAMPGAGMPGMSGANAAGAAASQAQAAQMMGGASAMGSANMQTAAAMQMMQAQMAQAQMAQAGGMGAGMQTEAAGEELQLSGDPESELKKGKLTIRRIDWIRLSPAVSPNGTAPLVTALEAAAHAMHQAGGTYRIDLYLDKHYSDAEVSMLGPQRLALIQSLTVERAAGGAPAAAGKIKKDKEPRVEIVRDK